MRPDIVVFSIACRMGRFNRGPDSHAQPQLNASSRQFINFGCPPHWNVVPVATRLLLTHRLGQWSIAFLSAALLSKTLIAIHEPQRDQIPLLQLGCVVSDISIHGSQERPVVGLRLLAFNSSRFQSTGPAGARPATSSTTTTFQSTGPTGARQVLPCYPASVRCISIHRPCGGPDVHRGKDVQLLVDISIHGPRGGPDLAQ